MLNRKNYSLAFKGISLGQINSAIKKYGELRQVSMGNSWIPTLFWTWAGEDKHITKLREFVALFPDKNDSYQLTPQEVFKLAIILYHFLEALTYKEVKEALIPIINDFMIERFAFLLQLLTSKNINEDTQVALFDALCKVPTVHVKLVAQFFLAAIVFNVPLLPKTIELIVEHPDRLEQAQAKLEDLLAKNNGAYRKILFSSDAMNVFLGLIKAYDVQTRNEFFNQVIISVLSNETHVNEVVFALVWLANHGIITPENLAVVNANVEHLSCLPKMGLDLSLERVVKKEDVELNEKLFKFAIEEDMKRKKPGMTLFVDVRKGDETAAISVTPVVLAKPN